MGTFHLNRHILSFIIVMLYVFLSLIAFSAAMPNAPMRSTLSNRIVNGEDVTTTSVAPWQVSLQRFGSHFCGGSLLNARYVMSACHCNNVGTTVVAGTTDYRYPKVSVRGSFQCHPSYSTRNNDYDYAILTLDSEIQEDSDIGYIQVASKDYAAGTSAQITGWGLTNAANNAVPTQLQGATTVLVSMDDCARTWGSRNLSDRMQCAGGQGINSGCMGDSGGPLAVQEGRTWYLVGNTSWGSSTCKVSMPSIWSKNSVVYSWIQGQIA